MLERVRWGQCYLQCKILKSQLITFNPDCCHVFNFLSCPPPPEGLRLHTSAHTPKDWGLIRETPRSIQASLLSVTLLCGEEARTHPWRPRATVLELEFCTRGMNRGGGKSHALLSVFQKTLSPFYPECGSQVGSFGIPWEPVRCAESPASPRLTKQNPHSSKVSRDLDTQ